MAKQVYAGMDVHLNSIAVVWGGVREKARNVVVPNSEEGLRQLVDTIGREGVWAVYEASSAGFEVFDELTRLGWKVSVVAPTHIPKSVKSRKRKTDVEDAKRLWEVLIAHGELGTAMPAVWIPGPQLREDREVVRRRLQLGESLCRVKNRITALLRMHQTRRPKEIRTPWSQKHVAWLRGLCESGPVGPRVREMLRSYLRELEFLNAEVEEVSAQLESLAREDAYRSRVDKLTGRLGVGILTAMTFLLELGDMDRFNNRRQIASYLGLVPTSHESGEADNRKGHITRMGPVRIRKVLNQAAWAIVRDDPAWRSTYDRLSTRRGPKKAIVALMRKLGIELWQLAKSA